MKLRLANPTHRLAIDTLSFARKLGITASIEYRPGRSSRLVIVANGSPDNRVILALAHTLNGHSVVDIAFPEHKHLAVIPLLSEYAHLGYEKILVVVDQESMSLEEIHKAVRRHLGSHLEVRGGGRLVIARLEPPRSMTIVIAVSGLDDNRFEKHTIEDHLLHLAEDLGIIGIPKVADPKRLWESVKDKHDQI